MNRLLVKSTRQVLSRRPLISSLETGGHAHAKTGYALFSSHPAWYRYLGMLVCAQSPMAFWVFFVDHNWDDRKLEQGILGSLFSEDFILRDLNLTVVATGWWYVSFFIGRTLLFHNLNMWNN